VKKLWQSIHFTQFVIFLKYIYKVGKYVFFNFVGRRNIVNVEEQFLLAGIFLMVLEVAIPGFGVCAAGSILCFTVAAYFFMGGGIGPLMIIVLAYVIVIAVVVWLCKTMPSDSKWNPIVLLERQNATKSIEKKEATKELVGKKGKALSVLRPAGTAMIDGKRMDVLTEGDYLPSNIDIEVIKVEGSKVIVRQAK
jgi:membrane-bound serine protease (ClpP class)